MNGAGVALSSGERLRRSLSFTELQAMRALVAAVPGDEGTVVASQMADKFGFTRSVIVNAVRKCEAAGVISARSLGMKGTYLQIHDRAALEQAVAS